MNNLLIICVSVFFGVTAFFTVAKFFSLYAIIFNRKINETERDWNYTPTVTVMMSAFNEGQSVYNSIISIMNSNYPANKLNVVAFDDYSKDDTFEWMLKAQKEYPDRIIARKNCENIGKSMTLSAISKVAGGEILISTDSDIIFDTNAVRELVSCFADAEIGSVGGQCRILNLNDSMVASLQPILYARSYYFYKSIENLGLTARCLTGQMVAFRREVYLPLMEHLPQRKFLGVPVTYGEDTYITQQIVFGIGLSKRWKVFTNIRALGWTGTPATWKKYMNQQLRWRRGTLLNGINSIRHLAGNISSAGIITAIVCTIPLIMSLSLLALLLWSIAVGFFLPALLQLLFLVFASTYVSAHIYNLTIGRKDPYGPILRPWKAALGYTVWFPINVWFLTIIAACSLDDGGWVTRQNTSNQ